MGRDGAELTGEEGTTGGDVGSETWGLSQAQWQGSKSAGAKGVEATRQRKEVKSRGVTRPVLRLARAYTEFLYGKGLVWFGSVWFGSVRFSSVWFGFNSSEHLQTSAAESRSHPGSSPRPRSWLSRGSCSRMLIRSLSLAARYILTTRNAHYLK